MELERIIPSAAQYDKGELIAAILEQKTIGVFHGDLKDKNILYDGKRLVLIDYDQALFDEEIIDMPINVFAEYMDEKIREKLQVSAWELLDVSKERFLEYSLKS